MNTKNDMKKFKNSVKVKIISISLILLVTGLGCRASLFGIKSESNSTEVQNQELSLDNEHNTNNSKEEMVEKPQSSTLPNGHIDSFSITIPQLNNRQRTIEIYLPPDYFDTDHSYPVIYLFDGEYLFDPPNPNGGDYQIDETLDNLYAKGKINGMIAVGIRLDKQHLWTEYSPWVNHNMYDWITTTNGESIEGGEGFTILEFLVNTLKPEIDNRYRTLTDRENTAIGGYCRTAILPIVAGLDYPNVFSMVMAMSPTVWFTEEGGHWLSNNYLINHIESGSVSENVRFFLHVGTEEVSGKRPPIKDSHGKRITYPQAYLEGAEKLALTLVENGAPQHNVYFEIIEGSSGGRDLWGSRFSDAILWLFDIQ